MISDDEIMKNIDNMSDSEVQTLLTKVLDKSGIKYRVGSGKINPEDILPREMLDFDHNSCTGCMHSPPSSCDGKPCCICDTSDKFLSCYENYKFVN